MEEKIFDECRIKYNDFAKDYMKKVEEQRALVCKQVKVKGEKYNVIPFRHERLGDKLNGKIVDEIEMKDEYHVYGFDEEGRIRLVERPCTCFKKFYDFECYDYAGDRVYEYLCSLISVTRVGISIFEGDKIKETYRVYDKGRWSHDCYIYEGGFLSGIDVCLLDTYGKIRKWHEKFFYNDNKKLMLIQEQIKESCRIISQGNDDVRVDTIEIAINSVRETPMLNIIYMFERNAQIAEYIAKNEIVLRKFPLDDFETEKVMNSVLRAAVDLWEEKTVDEDIHFKVTKEGITVPEDENKLPGWLKKDPRFYFEEGKICYRNLGCEKRAEAKSAKGIYKDMKKMLNKKECLQKQIEIFEKIGKIPVKSEYDGEDIFMMNAETILYKERLMFGITLVRQIPYEDEFIRIGITMVYELNDDIRLLSETYWSDETDLDFFSYIKGTQTYGLLCKEKVYDVNVFWEET